MAEIFGVPLTWGCVLKEPGDGRWRDAVKRIFDIAVSAAGLAVLSPVLLLLGAWIALDSAGPIFYKGVRAGLGNAPFRMLKFRTMVVNADKLGASSTAGDDVRITRAGRLLRAGKLDELPQLWNVFLGQMSFVGPRPQVQWAVDLYTPEEREVLAVRPGITDYASIRFRNEGEILKGSPDPDRDYMGKIAPEKMRLGRYYVRTHSLLKDIKLIVATAGSVLGINPDWALPGPRDVDAVLGAGRPAPTTAASSPASAS